MLRQGMRVVFGMMAMAVAGSAFPALASNPLFIRDLSMGASGEDVRRLQARLQEDGYFAGSPTGYFGPRTLAAVANWQTRVGVVPARGYFGAKSRVRMNASVPETRPLPAPAVRLALDPGHPASGGVLISNSASAAARVPVMGIAVTAGPDQDVRLSRIVFRKTGVLSDASLSGAYLIADHMVVASYRSIAAGAIHFGDVGWRVARGSTRTIWLAIDPVAGLPAGNTAAFLLATPADMVFEDESGAVITAEGAFPLRGGLFTTTSVSNPDLAELSIEALPIAHVLLPGTADNVIGSWHISVRHGAALLRGLRLRALGDADGEAIERIRLLLDGKEVGGAPLSSVASDGTAVFDLSRAPVPLRIGDTLMEVRADITGSPGDELQMAIHAPHDIDVMDVQYRVPIHGQAEEGSAITIQAGTLIMRPL